MSVFSGMGYLFGDDPSGEFMPDWSDELDDSADEESRSSEVSDFRWKDDDERDVSYLYRENELLGCVRNYAPIAKEGEEWQAYRSPMHATYHPDKETAKAALLNALQAVPAQTLTVEEERR